METTYKALQFSKHDTVTRQDLNQLVANYRWINDNTPTGRLFRGTNLIDANTIMIAGKVKVNSTKHKDTTKVNVKFGSGFDPTCRPMVTTGIVVAAQKRIFCNVQGPKGTGFPDHTGFQVRVLVDEKKRKNDKIQKDFYVHWSAFGFRPEDIVGF